MKGKSETDRAKALVLSVYEEARCVHKAFGSVIMSGPVEIGTGFDEAAAWIAAAYRIIKSQENREKK